MRLDQGSLIFRKEKGECPPWETALGQSKDPRDDMPPYYFKAEGYENILKGMLYNSVPLARISCVFGKKKVFVSAVDSFSDPQNQEIQLASKFDNVVVHYNGKRKTIKNSPIILLLTKTQDIEKSHFGRRSIKYSPHTKFEDAVTNQESFDKIQSCYEDRLMCYGLFIEHFDVLHLYCVKAGVHYDKSEWNALKLPTTDWTDWVDWEIKEREKNDFQKYMEFPIFDKSFVQDLNESQIVQKLASILKLEWEKNGYTGVHYFGFKYSKIIKSIKASPAEIIKQANGLNPVKEIPSSYDGEILKTTKVFECAEKDCKVVSARHENNALEGDPTDLPVIDSDGVENDRMSLDVPDFDPVQVIYYGVPGCGKSHSVEKVINKAIADFNKDKVGDFKITYEKQVVRTVFHPDYCNSDFIGQIMPKKKEGGIDYEFKPGPLANIIRKAYLNPSKPYFLIIEEINRGNAAAIFGESFQLLDRYKKGEHSSNEEIQNEKYDYTEGWSKYSINNDDVNGFILLGGESGVTEKEPGVDYESDSAEAPKSAIKIPSRNMHFATYCGIRLPPNLSLYATMNTSDQNVFTLDNAFQRRWEMKQIQNKLKDKVPENLKDEEREAAQKEVDQYNEYIGGPIESGGTGVKWGAFREKINKIIELSAEENGLSSMEDKRLGGWFITPKNAPDDPEGVNPQITKKAFAEKVLKYLWDDAFKFDRKSHFGNVITLEDLIENFEKKGFKVFVEKSAEIAKLQPDNPTRGATGEESRTEQASPIPDASTAV